jgi:hypothetical protein
MTKRRHTRHSRIALIAGVFLSFMISGCERDLSIRLEPSNPPVFELNGSGRLAFFYVLEVPSSGKATADSPKLWEIRPAGNDKISELPSITYGVVPSGFIQTVPTSGMPPVLVEKKTYEAGGAVSDANGGSIWFVIQNDKSVLQQKPTGSPAP